MKRTWDDGVGERTMSYSAWEARARERGLMVWFEVPALVTGKGGTANGLKSMARLKLLPEDL